MEKFVHALLPVTVPHSFPSDRDYLVYMVTSTFDVSEEEAEEVIAEAYMESLPHIRTGAVPAIASAAGRAILKQLANVQNWKTAISIATQLFGVAAETAAKMLAPYFTGEKPLTVPTASVSEPTPAYLRTAVGDTTDWQTAISKVAATYDVPANVAAKMLAPHWDDGIRMP